MLLHMAVTEEKEEVGERVCLRSCIKARERGRGANERLSADNVRVNIHVCKIIRFVTSDRVNFGIERMQKSGLPTDSLNIH